MMCDDEYTTSPEEKITRPPYPSTVAFSFKNPGCELCSYSRQCGQRYETAVSERLAGFLSALGALALAGFSTPPAPAPDRATVVATAAGALDAALTAWQAAITDRSAWQESVAPLPCPIDP